MSYEDFKNDFTIKREDKNGLFYLYVYRKKARSKVKVNECPYHFKKATLRDQWLDTFLTNYKKGMEEQARIKEYKNGFTNPYKKGNIFYRAYGSVQTKVQFYEVVKIYRLAVTLKQLKTDRDEKEYNAKGYIKPIKGEYTGNSLIKGFIFYIEKGKVIASLRELNLWDGKPILFIS